ncbi:MAG: glycosyltransferase [Gemmatimonadaceae bacterium]
MPIWNGAERLTSSLQSIGSYLAERDYTTELILVDDHSDAATAAAIDAFRQTRPCVAVLRNDANRGKGFSVSRGMLHARGRIRVFTDADLAYPPEEIGKLLAEVAAGADIAIACRVLPESRYVMSPSFFSYLYTRHVMSRIFNGAVRYSLLPGILDTQAGLKAFTANAAEVIFPRVTIGGFGFDVEALYIARLHGLRVRQTAVTFRYDDEPSTVSFLRDVARMVSDLGRIAWNGRGGRYE